MTPLDREFLGVAFNFHKGKHDFCPRLSDCRSHYAHLIGADKALLIR